MKIEVNNQMVSFFDRVNEGVLVTTAAPDGNIYSRHYIPDGEIIMLLDYWFNCKVGLEQSDYIKAGNPDRRKAIEETMNKAMKELEDE